MAFDYSEGAALALELCTEFGRDLKFYKLSNTPADPLKPGRGPGAPVRTNEVSSVGAFVIPNTSIPTESRGLAFDWIDQDLLRRVREVCLVPASGLPDLDDYKLILDGGEYWKIIWGQCFKPGPTRLFYVFGVLR